MSLVDTVSATNDSTLVHITLAVTAGILCLSFRGESWYLLAQRWTLLALSYLRECFLSLPLLRPKSSSYVSLDLSGVFFGACLSASVQPSLIVTCLAWLPPCLFCDLFDSICLVTLQLLDDRAPCRPCWTHSYHEMFGSASARTLAVAAFASSMIVLPHVQFNPIRRAHYPWVVAATSSLAPPLFFASLGPKDQLRRQHATRPLSSHRACFGSVIDVCNCIN